MSQAGLIDIEAAVPTIPTKFIADSDSAVPVANELEILGGTGVSTTGSGNTITINSDGLIGPGVPVTDNAVVRWDTTSGTLTQNSVVLISDVGAATGFTQINVDNLQLDGNTVSSTDTDGDIILSPNGTGGFVVPTSITAGESEKDVDFTINGAAISARIALHTSGTSDLGGFVSERHSSIAAFGAHSIFLRTKGAEGSPAIVADNDSIARLVSAGYDGTDFAQTAEIRVEIDGTPGTNDMPGRILLMTSADGTQTPVEGLRLDNSQVITLANALPVGSGGSGQTTYTDGQLLIGNSTGNTLSKSTLTGGTGITITNGSGTITIDADNNGDVVGPASATDNAIARYDGTTGKLIQNSAVTIDDNENIFSSSSYSGNTKFIGTFNTPNTANSAAKFTAIVGGTSAGDVWTEYRVGSARSWSEGIDNNDSQTYKITTVASSTISPSLGTTVVNLTTAGQVSFPAATLTENGLMLVGASGLLESLGNATDGQIPIGSTGADPVLATITAGTDISITNAAGAITINSTATGGGWIEETTTSRALSINEEIIANNAATITMTLPTTAALGSQIRVVGKGLGLIRIAQNASEIIHFGTATTTTGAGGYLESTQTNDAIELVCILADTEWAVISSIGNWDVV